MRAPITILLLAAAALTPAALAFAPDETVHIGVEPARIVRYHKEVQHRLGQSAAWAAFQADFGETWQARFDERTGLPHRAWGPGIDLGELQDAQDLESSLRDLIARHPQLFGVSGAELGPARIGYIARTDTWYATFDQQVQGVPVWRGGLTFRVRFGKLVLFGVETHPAARGLSVSSQLNAELAIQEAVRQGPAASAFHDAPEARLIVFPEERDGQLHYRLAWETRTRTSSPPGLWVSLIDARSGELLHVWNEVRFLTGQITGLHNERTLDGKTAVSPMPLLTVKNGAGASTTTDWSGNFTLEESGSFSVGLTGSYITVRNRQTSNGAGSFTGSSFQWTTSSATQAEIDSYVFLHQVRDFWEPLTPEVSMVDDALTSNVNVSGSCNAYYDGNVNFYRAGSGCNNTGSIADVNYHEWGHGFHYTSLQAGTFDGSISEGIGDVTSALLTGDPVIAPYFSTTGAGIREIATDLRYPEDITGEVHADGLIFAGAIWDLWAELETVYDAETAWLLTAQLFADAIKAGPTIPDSYDEVVAADDDNGDLSDGTPNQCHILNAFALHGLGPGGSGGSTLTVAHETLVNQEPTATEYPLSAELTSFAPDCVAAEAEEAVVHFSIDGGATWADAALSLSGKGDVAGAIPAQPQGSIVDYYVSVTNTDGDTVQNPTGGSINPHSFIVGELIEVYCEDFEDDDGGYTSELVAGDDEEGANDWQRGVPQGKAGDPDFAWSGRRVWGNDLGSNNYNGEYQAEKHNRLSSVAITLPTDSDTFYLQFRRWLTVEDGYYDKARVLVDGEVAWENHKTKRDIGDEHHLDDQWALHSLPVADLDGDGAVVISWEIESDQGLHMGGWNIDDVCVYALKTVDIPVDTGGDDTGGGDDTAGGDDDTGDVGQADDTGEGGGVSIKPACGCAAEPAPSSGLALLGALAGLALSRRRR